MINTLLTMSLTGSTVVLAWLAVDKLLRTRLSALWHDRILRLALFFMLVPVGRLWAAARELLTDFLAGRTVDVPAVMPVNPALDLPAAIPGTVVTPNVVPDIPVTPPVAQSAAVSVSVDVFWLLTLIWLLGAAVMLCYKLWCYWRFKKLLGKERRPLAQEGLEVFWDCKAELSVSGVVGVFINPAVPTPLATGLIWPVILLPDVSLEQEELRYLLLHELTHIKRRDLWVRFLALCALVLHWYNPLMHLLNQKIKERSEQSCDEQVARSMSKAERLAYGSMLLKMVTNPAVGPSEWAVTLSTKESIQQRLSRVVNAGRLSRADKAVAVVVAAGLLICGAVAACSMREPIAVETPPPAQEEPSPGPEKEQVPVRDEAQRELPEAARYGHAQALTQIDWANFQIKLTQSEVQAVRKYLPILEGGRFIWLAEDGQTQTDIQGLLDSAFRVNGYTAETVYVESILFADIFQTGEENMCLLLPHLGYMWLILHEEDGVFYGIDMPVRWFGSVQKDGLYAGSGSAFDSYYHRMTFENGAYTVSDVAEVHENVLFINGQQQSDAAYREWKKANLKEEAPWYSPSGEKYGSQEEPSTAVSPEAPETSGPVAEPMADNAPAPEAVSVPETMTIGAVEYETYVDEHGVVRLKDAVGNIKYLDLYRLTLMDTLVDGKYPVNSRGETYGYAELADFVGQEPDLICTYERSNMGMESRGYVAREDYYADFSDPEVAAQYQLVDANWLNLPMEGDSREWIIPLYDAERNVIGSYSIKYGKENDPASQGELIGELERASAEMNQEVSDDRKDEVSFVQEPGSEKFAVVSDGTGAEVKIYLSNHGKYLIPNDVSILDSANWPEALWEELPDGAYPVNSKGESYGSMVWKTYLQHEPDLISAKGINGESGYVWWEDIEVQFKTAQDLDKVEWTDEGFLIPLYDSEHNRIGTYCERTGRRINGVELNKNTVEEIRAFLSQ